MADSPQDQPVAVVTGSSRGLGRALAEHFLAQGYRVAGCSRGDGTIDHADYHHSQVDIGDEAAVTGWAKNVRRGLKRVDVVVANAGLARAALLLSMTPGDVFDDFMRVNFAGVFYTLREFSKVMMRTGGGRVIAISSTMVPLSQDGTGVYSATKAGITSMTKVLARELAPKGITCNVIAPAMMRTDASAELAKDGDWEERMLALQTFPRVIDFGEVCHAADFFVSEKARSITGQVVYIGLVD